MLALIATLLAQCPEACCTVDPYADRTIDGYTHFPKLASFEGSINIAPSLNTALNAPAGVTTISVAPPLNDQSLRLVGRKRNGDVQPGVIATGQEFVDSGTVFAVLPGGACSTPIFSVSTSEIGFGTGVTASCGSTGDKQVGALVDQSGVSEHVSLTCSPRYFVTIQGRLGENRLNVGLDGGCDTELSDGGCYLEYAALHGEQTVTASVARNRGGWLQEWRNPVSDGTDHARAFVDIWGGYGQRHGMTRAQFPKCPADVEVTQPQLQFYYRGAVESTMLYAFDEHRWYFCTVSGWRMLKFTGE
jgi:hypothetical protein